MADANQWKVGEVNMVTGGGYGFAITNRHGAPLILFTFATREEAEAALPLIEATLTSVTDVRSYPEPGRRG
jgi:hypothetical protein